MKKFFKALGIVALLTLGACGSGGGSTGGKSPNVQNNPPSNPANTYKSLYNSWTLSSTSAPQGAYVIQYFNLSSFSSTPFSGAITYPTGCISLVEFQIDTIKETVPNTSNCQEVIPGEFYAFWSISNGILRISWDPQGSRVDYYR